jgi:hypothetical protein
MIEQITDHAGADITSMSPVAAGPAPSGGFAKLTPEPWQQTLELSHGSSVPAAQKLIDALADQAIAQLANITPHLNAAQLAKLVTAFKQGVAGLQSQGYLTAAQASTLDGLADHIQP